MSRSRAWLRVKRLLILFSFVHLLFQPALLREAWDCPSCSCSSCNLALNSSCTLIVLHFSSFYIWLFILSLTLILSPLSFFFLFPPLLSLCLIPCLCSDLCIYLSFFTAVMWIPSGWHILSPSITISSFHFNLIQVTVKEKKKPCLVLKYIFKLKNSVTLSFMLYV